VRRGDAAVCDVRPLVPAIRALAATQPIARELLAAFGEPIPDPRALEPYRDRAPQLRALHGAYAIARAGDALGLWDHGTGKLLFAVDDAQLFALVPQHTEAAVLRAWTFERYAIPAGTRVSALAIPESLAHGRPMSLAFAADLVTVWCDDYRFHIKLDPDRLLDEKPSPGKRGKRKTLR
jgi:hypothetical protein